MIKIFHPRLTLQFSYFLHIAHVLRTFTFCRFSSTTRKYICGGEVLIKINNNVLPSKNCDFQSKTEAKMFSRVLLCSVLLVVAYSLPLDTEGDANVRVIRSPHLFKKKPLLGLLGGGGGGGGSSSVEHHHYYHPEPVHQPQQVHHGGGHGGSASFASSSAGSSGHGSQSQSQSLAFAYGPYSGSISQSQSQGSSGGGFFDY